MKKINSKINLWQFKYLILPCALLIVLELLNQWSVGYTRQILGYRAWFSALPYLMGTLVFLWVASNFKIQTMLGSLRNVFTSIVKQKSLFLLGFVVLALFYLVTFLFLYPNATDIYVSSSYNIQNVFTTVFINSSYAFAIIFSFVAFLNMVKSIRGFYAVILFTGTLITTNYFLNNSAYYIVSDALIYLIIGFTIVMRRTSLSLLSSFSYNFLSTAFLCACSKYVLGALVVATRQDLGYTPAFLYSFQLVAMGAVAAYYGRQAYLVSLNRAELVDRGYMMVTDKQGVETPMLRATYQYSVMQAIKPWIAITEAGKKRRRGRVIMQPLQKGWSFYEVFNAQGECLTHGFIDANMDLERMPESYLQDNRPKLAVAWELDTDALYYLRVEFEGETLYGALRMYSYEADHKRMAHDVSNRLYNTWIHPNEEEILTCTLYKASGEEVLVKSLYGKYHDS
jgi:hypothetical protein